MLETARAATQLPSHALAVHNVRANLIVVVLVDPHRCKCRQARQDGAADPDRELALGRRHDARLDDAAGHLSDLLLQAPLDALKHARPARQHNVVVQLAAHIDVALADGLVHQVVDALGLEAEQRRVKQHLRAAEALAGHSDLLTIWQLKHLVDRGACVGSVRLGSKVLGHVAQLLLDVPDNLHLRCIDQLDTTLLKDAPHVLSEVAASNVQPLHCVWQAVALIDGHGVGDAVARVTHHARRTARRIQRQDSLDRNIHRRHVERLKHDGRHLLAVDLWVAWRLRQHHRP
mmetsp:Transcript_77812/g.171831  ORF Transcript_77812/g.171831 Transcript_77812/m.171831 type:complete len:289 (-) Transcript_77812:209-1075(-)